MGSLKNKVDYSQYKCPYSHLKKECGHELHSPGGYEDAYSVWCPCGFRAPVFYLDPEDLKLEKVVHNKVLTGKDTMLDEKKVKEWFKTFEPGVDLSQFESPNDSTVTCEWKTDVNTDIEIWRKVKDDYYSPSIHVTEFGNIGIDVGGHVLVAPVEEWHKAGIKLFTVNTNLKNC